MDFIDLYNDIKDSLIQYYKNSKRDIKKAVEIEKIRYQLRLYQKRKDSLFNNIGKSIYNNYQHGSVENYKYEEYLTLADILESFIHERKKKIDKLINEDKEE